MFYESIVVIYELKLPQYSRFYPSHHPYTGVPANRSCRFLYPLPLRSPNLVLCAYRMILKDETFRLWAGSTTPWVRNSALWEPNSPLWEGNFSLRVPNLPLGVKNFPLLAKSLSLLAETLSLGAGCKKRGCFKSHWSRHPEFPACWQSGFQDPNVIVQQIPK